MTVAHDYNVLREPEVIAEELELIRRFGTTSRGGAGTVDKPMTREVPKTRIDRWTQGAMPSPKTRLGKMLRQWMNRKPPARKYQVSDNDEYATSVHHLRLGLGLEAKEEEMKNKKGLTREDLLKIIEDKGELSTATIAHVLKVTAGDVRGLLEGMVKDKLITRRQGKLGDRGGRRPILYGPGSESAAKKAPPPPMIDASDVKLVNAQDELIDNIRQMVEDYVSMVVDVRVKREVDEKMAAVRAALLT